LVKKSILDTARMRLRNKVMNKAAPSPHHTSVT
jgi:hypothetical protein